MAKSAASPQGMRDVRRSSTLSHPQRTLLLKWVDVLFFKEEEGGKSEVKFQIHFDLQVISCRKSWNFL